MKYLFSILITALTAISPAIIMAQSAPIAIDDRYDDWTADLANIEDVSETVSGIDLIKMQVSNDEEFLYIRIITDTEFDLLDKYPPQDLRLYLDTDNNENTGLAVQTAYGAEFEIRFKSHLAIFYVDPQDTVSFTRFSLRASPTVSSNEFEIAIKRSAIPDRIHPLFTSPSIKILLVEGVSGDRLPNQGESFLYTFDETPVTPYIPIEVHKEDKDLIRIIAYNTRLDGLIKDRQSDLLQVVTALNPDIIGFSECHETTPDTVKILLDQVLPLDTPEGWFVDKHINGDLITASHWPFIKDWDNLERQYPALIDLPQNYETDLLFINAHLSSGNRDSLRQNQADQFISFILDAKSEGGNITLPKGTPFVIAGDMNLVGLAQQLTTLITGDIQNTVLYGDGFAPDWDNTDIADNMALQTEKRMDYTYRHDKKNNYPPGKLDYLIYSDAVLCAEKSFVLQTETMPYDRLLLYNLDTNNTKNASDHFPVVSDFSIIPYTGIAKNRVLKHTVYPNPFLSEINIILSEPGRHHVVITNINGARIYSNKVDSLKSTINIEKLKSGFYFISIIDSIGNKEIHKLIKV